MVVVRDDNTRALRLLAGAGDLAVNAVPALLVPLFEEDARFEVRSAPGVGTSYLGFHTAIPPFDDIRVRRAVAHAVDRETLIETKLGGRARLARGWIPPGHWAYEEDVDVHGYDLDRARALLDEAGYPDPDGPGGEPRMTVALRTSSDRFRLSIARAVAAMLGDVGIAVDVRPSETATMIADLNHGRFQMTLLQVPEVFEPHVLSWFFSSDHVPIAGEREGANRWRFRSAALDAALERGRRSAERPARIDAYRDAQRILATELPVAPLWHEDVVAIIGPGARAYDVPRDGRLGTLAR
jgi:peptide/nickel transport system substrate-binding protein